MSLDFPLLSARPSARASVVSWRHGGADVALLRLGRPVEGARPAGLVDGTAVREHPFRVFGHPDGADHGVWVPGTLRAGQAAGPLQMEAHLPGPRVTHGRLQRLPGVGRRPGRVRRNDRRRGVVSGNGQAHLTVTATWKPEQDKAPGS
ncbi:hypothetical protein EW053_19875 [Streptomyces sp. IB2014 016-6]|nr:hypothetical protein EW053_19875 [Streptomyces sp. IB2014 016-6]